MSATHHRDFLHKLRVLLVFIEFHILICIMIRRQRRTHLNPAPPPALQPPNPWVMPWILKKQEKGCYSNLLAELIHTDIPGYQNLFRLLPAFFDLIEKRLHHCIKKSVSNFRKPLEVGMKLAITPGNRRDLHLLAVSLPGWPNHHLQIRPPGLPSHPC